MKEHHGLPLTEVSQSQIQETCDRIKAVLRDRYHSTQEANSILEGKTPLTKINLAPLEEQLVDNDYYHH
jgi:hypothetical protein